MYTAVAICFDYWASRRGLYIRGPYKNLAYTHAKLVSRARGHSRIPDSRSLIHLCVLRMESRDRHCNRNKKPQSPQFAAGTSARITIVAVRNLRSMHNFKGNRIFDARRWLLEYQISLCIVSVCEKNLKTFNSTHTLFINTLNCCTFNNRYYNSVLLLKVGNVVKLSIRCCVCCLIGGQRFCYRSKSNCFPNIVSHERGVNNTLYLYFRAVLRQLPV